MKIGNPLIKSGKIVISLRSYEENIRYKPVTIYLKIEIY